MRLLVYFLILASLASCASDSERGTADEGRKPQAIEDYAFPGRSR